MMLDGSLVSDAAPKLGLVCITRGDAVRYKTMTRKTYWGLAPEECFEALQRLYTHNLTVLYGALDFCAGAGIGLYRLSSQLFPLSDLDATGQAALASLAPDLAPFAAAAVKRDVRVVIHPEQFVVLNSDRPEVISNSVAVLKHYAHILDLLNLPRSSWTAMNIHGGKRGKADLLVKMIKALPPNVRSRLTLENDERSYGAAELLTVCERAGVPLVFDAHHHVVKEGLGSFDDPEIAHYTRLARATWQPEDRQIVHLSNGESGAGDRKHSDFIRVFPPAFVGVGWIEVEAKAKEEAISRIEQSLPYIVL